MTQDILFPETGERLPIPPSYLLAKFKSITTTPEIHSGLPHIKNTRILAADIFRAIVKGYSYERILMDFKEIGVSVSKRDLEDAFNFTVSWLNKTINEEQRKIPR